MCHSNLASSIQFKHLARYLHIAVSRSIVIVVAVPGVAVVGLPRASSIVVASRVKVVELIVAIPEEIIVRIESGAIVPVASYI